MSGNKCYNCYGFAHMDKECKEKIKCVKCGSEEHVKTVKVIKLNVKNEEKPIENIIWKWVVGIQFLIKMSYFKTNKENS